MHFADRTAEFGISGNRGDYKIRLNYIVQKQWWIFNKKQGKIIFSGFFGQIALKIFQISCQAEDFGGNV
ncbi:MAG: hypothetical protein UFJ18_13670 [Blautia sp.]|nr:hypothetical protein [Blautia sp.]